MRLETLPIARLTQMSHEDLLEKVRQIREARVAPSPTKKTAAKKRSVKRKESVKDLVAKMTPEERKKLLRTMKGLK